MAVNLDERVDRLETIFGQFMAQTGAALLRMERDTERLKTEMSDFKKEMREERIQLNRRMGELARKLGTITESLVYPSIDRIIKETFGLEADDIMVNRERRGKNGAWKEFDIIALGGELVFLVSTQITLRNKYVDDFIADIDIFREYYPEYRERKLAGIIAALTIPEDQLRYAEKKGFLVLGIGEEIMEAKNRKGFKPKLW